MLQKLGLVCLFLSAVAPALASADDLVILNLRSVEGDDELASDLSGAIRAAASDVGSWNVSDREIPLAQMLLVHSCDSPTDECMREIAQSLHADRVLYGTIRRSSTGDDFRFEIDLRLFDTAGGSVVEHVEDSIARTQTDIDQLRRPAARYVAQLSGAVDRGSIRIVSESIGASVLVDNEDAGVIGDNGELLVEADEGIHTVAVQGEGLGMFERRINVRSGESTIVDAVLTAGDPDEIEAPGGGLEATTVVGIVSLGVAGVSMALFLASWLALDGIGEFNGIDLLEDSTKWTAYRRSVAQDRDACAQAETDGRNDILDICADADVFEAMWSATLVIGAVSLGAGIAFLMVGGGDDEPAVSLFPSFDGERASLDATMRF